MARGWGRSPNADVIADLTGFQNLSGLCHEAPIKTVAFFGGCGCRQIRNLSRDATPLTFATLRDTLRALSGKKPAGNHFSAS
ncbi:MAG: hypothetical protein LAT75_12885 [Candidatus Cyclonatronum sp.]|uniref:hypothetical protein n=1 Tax=Cyclonatronum sp. TaxID=3024185 RepID=UPI0025C5E6CD|nr:hypothetical protein [Cyclonatronum sp.]MCH8487757.1 hypothetical protein [Cyclonatronum sp.]